MSTALDTAIRFSVDHEVSWDRSVSGEWGIYQADPPPWNRLLGPVHDRGPVSGAIFANGKAMAQWGEPDRADLTFSVAKTYLALLAGVAHDRGLLPDVHEPVCARVPGIGFDDAHNRAVTWAQLLQQTSEWHGEFFGMPDSVDHNRAVTFATAPSGIKGEPRTMHTPGTFWEYNDVRINQLSLALLHLFRQPLPEVFREAVTSRVGASDDWRWVGYEHTWVELDGRRMQTVPGGTHWGGGMSISANDQLKIAVMLMNDGVSNGVRVLSSSWIAKMRTPSPLAPFYGYLVWLNEGRRIFPSLPESSYFAIGAGGSFSWIDPEYQCAVIVRWLDAAHADTFFAQVLAALKV